MSTFRGPRNPSGKIIEYKLNPLEGDEGVYYLTSRMAGALLQSLEYYKWMSRHLSVPPDLTSQEALNGWVDQMGKRLIKEMDPLENICEAIIGCITEDDDTKDALRNFIMNDSTLNNYYGDKIRSMITSELTGKLNPVTSDLDILFAQCVAIVEYTHTAIMDLLQILEVQSNNLELMTHIESIPMMKVFFTLVPVTDWLEFANYMLETFQEQYEANYTETIGIPPAIGTKWKIACKIFCLCKVDKEITINRIFDAINDLLSGYAVPSFDNLSEIVETVVGVNDNSEVMAYIGFFIMWGSARLTSVFGMSSITVRVLEAILLLADEPNNDHEILCVDCADDLCYDFKVAQHSFNVPNVGQWVIGEGIKRGGAGGRLDRLVISRNFSSSMFTAVKIYFNEPYTGYVDVRTFAGSVIQRLTLTNETEKTATFTARSGILSIDCIQPSNLAFPDTLRLTRVCLTPVP